MLTNATPEVLESSSVHAALEAGIARDYEIRRYYLRLEECQRLRLWMQRIWHPETFTWTKRGGPPKECSVTKMRRMELDSLGFGESFYQHMIHEEKEAKRELERLAEGHPLWPHFMHVAGIGLYLCGAFVAAGGDIRQAPRVSSFWKGMGLDVLPDGTAPRRIRGRKDVDRRIPALPHVTRVGEQIRQQIVRRPGTRLNQIYQDEKETYRRRYPERPKMWAHKHGLRIAQKILYACAWREWRLAYGLSAPDPYAFDILKHDSGRLVRFSDIYDD